MAGLGLDHMWADTAEDEKKSSIISLQEQVRGVPAVVDVEVNIERCSMQLKAQRIYYCAALTPVTTRGSLVNDPVPNQ